MGLALPAMDLQATQDFEVLKDNWPVISAFFALDNCAWQYSGMGDLLGLDYPAARCIWDGLGVTVDVETFAGVMLFTRTIVNELAKDRKK